MVRVAVIGAGRWGRNLVRNFAALSQLTTICDARESARQAMAGLYPQARVTADLDAVLGGGHDAAVVAVDAPNHHRVALACLEAGLHTYVEKPLALSSVECDELVAVARQRKRQLMVGHLLMYHPAVEYMKSQIDGGQVGEPRYLYFQRLNLGQVRSAENVWWSLAPHDISVACYLFEAEPVQVSAAGQAYIQEGIQDVVFANLNFADGRMAHIHVSWLDPHKIRKVTLVGSEKMVVFDDMEATEKVRVYDKGVDVQTEVASYADAITLRTGDILIPKIDGAEPLRAECRHFLDCIEKGATPRSDGENGRQVVRILEAGTRSLERGGEPVSLR